MNNQLEHEPTHDRLTTGGAVLLIVCFVVMGVSSAMAITWVWPTVSQWGMK